MLTEAMDSLNERERHILTERRLTDKPQTLEELSQVYDCQPRTASARSKCARSKSCKRRVRTHRQARRLLPGWLKRRFASWNSKRSEAAASGPFFVCAKQGAEHRLAQYPPSQREHFRPALDRAAMLSRCQTVR